VPVPAKVLQLISTSLCCVTLVSLPPARFQSQRPGCEAQKTVSSHTIEVNFAYTHGGSARALTDGTHMIQRCCHGDTLVKACPECRQETMQVETMQVTIHRQPPECMHFCRAGWRCHRTSKPIYATRSLSHGCLEAMRQLAPRLGRQAMPARDCESWEARCKMQQRSMVYRRRARTSRLCSLPWQQVAQMAAARQAPQQTVAQQAGSLLPTACTAAMAAEPPPRTDSL